MFVHFYVLEDEVVKLGDFKCEIDHNALFYRIYRLLPSADTVMTETPNFYYFGAIMVNFNPLIPG
jgi:hypothetical protein